MSKNLTYRPHKNLILLMEPVACPRPRVTKRGITFYPESYREFKKTASLLLTNQWKKDPLTTPLSIDILCIHTKPKSKIRKKTAEVRLPKFKGRGDLDNFVKSILDVLQIGGVIANDSQVFKLTAESWWGSVNERSHIQITINEGVGGSWSPTG